jgi:hypothetical protein
VPGMAAIDSLVLAVGLPRTRRLLLAAMALVLLAIHPAPVSAEYATLGAASENQTLVGPALGGSEVVWGDKSTPGAQSPEFSVLAAVPGSHGSTLFSTRLSSPEEEIDPLGLLASPTRLAFAYQVEAPECGPVSGACGLPDLREVLSVAAFTAPLNGPLRRLSAVSLKNGAIGLSGEDVVLGKRARSTGAAEQAYVQNLATGAPATAAGALGAGGLSVAGSFVASSSANDITVSTLAGAPVYSVLVPSGGEGCASDSSGARRDPQVRPAEPCGYALDADGTLAIASGAPASLAWASPAQPRLHPIALDIASPLLAISNDQIVYLAPVGASGAQLALTDLAGERRPVSFPVSTGAEAVSGLAFDGTSLAWADDGCVYAGPVPSSAPAAPPSPACEVVAIQTAARTESEKVTANGQVVIPLSCEHSPCSGSLTLSTVVEKVSATARHRRSKRTTVRIGSAQFRSLAVSGKDSVSAKLSADGLRLLEANGYRLNATVSTTVPYASTSQRASATISLDASRPKKTRPR